MNELDFLLLFVILVGVAIGLRRGLIRMFVSIVGIYITVLIVGYAYKPIGQTLSDGLKIIGRTAMWNLTYLILVMVMTIIVELLSRSLFEDTHIPTLRGLDNLLGGVAGALYGVLWASLLLVPIQFGISRTGGAWTEGVYESTLVPTLNNIFQNGVVDIVGFLFLDGVPKLLRNPVSQRTTYLLLNLASLQHLFF